MSGELMPRLPADSGSGTAIAMVRDMTVEPIRILEGTGTLP